MDLQQLRKQAKDLIKAVRRQDPAAVERLGDLPPRLASAQLVIAREHGFASWPALVHAAEATVERFVELATEDRRARAEALLAARPELARDRWAALVLGRGWDGAVDEVGGPRTWPPLHYVAHSCFRPVGLLRELLERGADPNAFHSNSFGPMSPLYGAAGVVHDAEMTRLLLEHGADPNGEPTPGDALYHAAAAADLPCARLLLEHGARVPGSNALGSAIDTGSVDMVRLLLEAGGDPEEGALLVHAVRRGCGPEMVRLLAGFGAPLDRPGGEWSTPRSAYRTAYQQAVLRGRDDLAVTLAELGAATAVAPEDLAVAAIARGERPDGPPPTELVDDAQEVLTLAVLDGRLDVVADLYGPGFFTHCGGGPPGTLLHHASWTGRPELVRELLARGAEVDARSGAEFDAPLAWAVLASQVDPKPGLLPVAELLVAAGATLEERFADVADGELAVWLEDRG